MANIIARVGKAIAQNKQDAKVILAKYGITPKDDKFSSIVKASFTAIKSGNKQLAMDLAALVAKNESKKGGLLSGLFTKKTTAPKVQAPVSVPDSGMEQRSTSSADGDSEIVIAASNELFNTISTGDVDTLSASAESEVKTVPMWVKVLIVIAILVLLYLGYKKYIKK